MSIFVTLVALSLLKTWVIMICTANKIQDIILNMIYLFNIKISNFFNNNITTSVTNMWFFENFVTFVQKYLPWI